MRPYRLCPRQSCERPQVPATFTCTFSSRTFPCAASGSKWPPASCPGGALETIAARIAPLGWRIGLQTDGRELPKLVDRLPDLPCPVTLDHYGKFADALPVEHPAVAAALQLLASGKGRARLTAPHAGRHRRPEPWPELIPLARTFLATAPDRVVWGSEWPQSMLRLFKIPIPDHALSLDLLLDYITDEAMIKRILVDSPASLHDFPAVN